MTRAMAMDEVLDDAKAVLLWSKGRFPADASRTIHALFQALFALLETMPNGRRVVERLQSVLMEEAQRIRGSEKGGGN